MRIFLLAGQIYLGGKVSVLIEKPMRFNTKDMLLDVLHLVADFH